MTTGTPEKTGYSPVEERLNTLTAGLGLAAVIGFLPFLFSRALASHHPHALAGAVVFAAALFLLYAASTTYHALRVEELKRRVRLIDHCAIFILIAGTYTPLIVGPLWQHQGLLLLSIEWGLALIGIVLKLTDERRFRRICDLIYVGMGWLGLFWLRPFAEEASRAALYWVLGGGVVYTTGIVFYKMKNRAYTHFLWHLFVFAGTACHAYAVWRYAL